MPPNDAPREADVAAIAESIATRSRRQTEQLIDRLVGSTWPGGLGDRSERGALEWVRRWAPKPVDALGPECSCAGGRCGLCN